MGKIEFANCQDARNQKKILELDCPRCHEPGGIEAFVKDGILAEDGVCDNCGYILPEGTNITMLDMVTNEYYYYIVNADDVRNNKYIYHLSDFTYKAKIDVITDALLLKEVFKLFKTTYLGAMTCDSTSQIDLRLLIK